MYIWWQPLYRWRLGACSPSLLSVGLRPVVFVAFTCREVGLKPRASCRLTLVGVSLQTTSRQSNNVPCERQTSPSLAPGAAAQSHRSRSRLRPRPISPQTNRQKPSSAPHISPRGTGPTVAQAANSSEAPAPLRNHCLQPTCTVRRRLPACCAPLAFSFYSRAELPLLTIFKICNMLDRSGSTGLSCFITWNLSRAAGLCLKEEWAAMVPSIIAVWGVDIYCWNHHFFYVQLVQPSVSLISNLYNLLMNSNICQVLWIGVFFFLNLYEIQSYCCYLYTFFSKNNFHIFL